MLANYFNVNKSGLIEDKTKPQLDTLPVTAIPVVAKISAGLPIYTEENIIEYTYIPSQIIKSVKELFSLKVSGNSMDKVFREDDVVIVEKDGVVENTRISVVNVKVNYTTVKRIVTMMTKSFYCPNQITTTTYLKFLQKLTVSKSLVKLCLLLNSINIAP